MATYAEAMADMRLDYTLSDAMAEYGVPIPVEALHRANVMAQSRVDEIRRRDPGYGAPGEGREREVLAALSRMGVPDRYLRVPADKRHVQGMLGGRGLYLWGGVGVGKTFAAASVARGWVASGRRCRWASSLQLLSDVREAYEGRAVEADVLAAYATAPLLVVDDLGKEVPTDWALSKVFEVFDRRYGSRLPVVVTSQMAPAELGQHLAQRGDRETAYAIVSRLEETCHVAHLDGQDRRRG